VVITKTVIIKGRRLITVKCKTIFSMYKELNDFVVDYLEERDMFSVVYPGLLRLAGRSSVFQTEADEEFYRIVSKYSRKMSFEEISLALLSLPFLNPCTNEKFLNKVLRFFSDCSRVFLYPLESTLYIAALLKGRASGLISEDFMYKDYVEELAKALGVKIENFVKGKCAFLSFARHDHNPVDRINAFEKVVTYGDAPLVRKDLNEVHFLERPAIRDIALFFKKGGKYEKLLTEHPLFYDFILETGFGITFFKGKVPLGEIAEIRHYEEGMKIGLNAVIYNGCKAYLYDEIYPYEEDIIINTHKPRLVKEVLNSRFLDGYVYSSVLKSIPIPEGISESMVEIYEMEVESREIQFFKFY